MPYGHLTAVSSACKFFFLECYGTEYGRKRWTVSFYLVLAISLMGISLARVLLCLTLMPWLTSISFTDIVFHLGIMLVLTGIRLPTNSFVHCLQP